jgi:hypothetical protein
MFGTARSNHSHWFHFAFKEEVPSSPVPGQQELAKQMVELSLSDPIQTGVEGRVESVKTSC